MDKGGSDRHSASPDENIWATLVDTQLLVTVDPNLFHKKFHADPCGYVTGKDQGSGAPRFCDAPAAPGSSYCPAHRALCQVAPGSAAAASIRAAFARAAARTDRPPPLLGAIELPEPLEADEDLGGFDLPRGGEREE